MYFLFIVITLFSVFPVMLYYSYTQTFSLILLYCWCSYSVSSCAFLDGVCLSGNKRITYSLTYLLITLFSKTTADVRRTHRDRVIDALVVDSLTDRLVIRLDDCLQLLRVYSSALVCVERSKHLA